MDSDFRTWLNREIDQRGWSLRRVAELGEITHTPIIRVANGQQNPTFEVCLAVAKAFDMLPEDVMRLANLFPPKPARSNRIRQPRIVYEVGQDERLITLWRQLAPDAQQVVLEVMERMIPSVEPRIIGAEDAADGNG